MSKALARQARLEVHLQRLMEALPRGQRRLTHLLQHLAQQLLQLRPEAVEVEEHLDVTWALEKWALTMVLQPAWSATLRAMWLPWRTPVRRSSSDCLRTLAPTSLIHSPSARRMSTRSSLD